MPSHMMSAVVGSTFKSPVRILARVFERSRDNWKQKYMDLKAEIKRYKNQAADARRSREAWKTKVRALEEQVRRLEEDLAQRQAEQDAIKTLLLR